MEKERKGARKGEKSVAKRVIGALLLIALLAVAGVAILTVRYFPVRHSDIINKYAGIYGLEPAFVCAVINAESGFDEHAVSSAGASGLMQLMEETAIWIAPMAGLPDFDYAQIFDPDINIRLGCYYLSYYRDKFGDLETALCAYNAGGGRVESWLADSKYSSDGKTLDVIPYAETREYVQKVFDRTRVYEVLLRWLP